MLGRELAYTAVDQVRLYRRAARRIDRQCDRLRSSHVEGAIERTGDGGEREAGFQGGGKADDAGEPNHRHDGHAAQSLWQDRPQRLVRTCEQLLEMLGTFFVGHMVFGSVST